MNTGKRNNNNAGGSSDNQNGNLISGSSRIQIKGISKEFGTHKVLNRIGVCIGEGEIFGLLGPSGAGKTTLIKILTGQLIQTEGVAELLGADTRKLTDRQYGRMGMMLDNTGLYERLTCWDNLLLFARIYGLSGNKAEEALKKVGLYEAKKQAVHNLSKGMKQRLVLARAMMNEPDILFLDEPTSGLDPANAKEIHKLIMAQKEKGTTIFLTTHHMEEAEKLCDNVALLFEGSIVEYGNPKELCRRYNHQNKIRLLLKSGQQILLENNSEGAEQTYSYLKEGLVETIHSTEPNLETVFMELTGRSFE